MEMRSCIGISWIGPSALVNGLAINASSRRRIFDLVPGARDRKADYVSF